MLQEQVFHDVEEEYSTNIENLTTTETFSPGMAPSIVNTYASKKSKNILGLSQNRKGILRFKKSQ